MMDDKSLRQRAAEGNELAQLIEQVMQLEDAEFERLVSNFPPDQRDLGSEQVTIRLRNLRLKRALEEIARDRQVAGTATDLTRGESVPRPLLPAEISAKMLFKIENKWWKGDTIRVDGYKFVTCHFTHCTLEAATPFWILEKCSFSDCTLNGV